MAPSSACCLDSFAVRQENCFRQTQDGTFNCKQAFENVKCEGLLFPVGGKIIVSYKSVFKTLSDI